MAQIPSTARVVIIGGGVIGCSVAYHLAKQGWKDVVLLERRQLTCGTTWHAAGLIGQLRATHTMTQLAKYSADLYYNLEEETGAATGLKQNGSVSVALTNERLEELQRGASMARCFGLEVHDLSPDECKQHYPLLNLEGVTGGVFLPTDGQGDPTNIALALAKGARQYGAKIIENVKVTGIKTSQGRITGVSTADGEIACENVVNCAGMWAREVGAMAGVRVPVQACEHFYILTEGIDGLQRDLPVLRVPDECAYYKEDAGKILLGAFEPLSKPWAVDGIPEDFFFDQLPEDFDHFEPVLEQAINRVPLLEQAGIATFFNGPESFTPDDRYLLGETPDVKGLFIAAGFNSIGIQSAGGAGRALAEWMEAGEPTLDLWDVDIRRMYPMQSTRSYLKQRVSETLGLLYADHFPYRQYASARGLRRTPLHELLAENGACFGETAGWERANWFLPKEAKERGETAEYQYTWARQNWFPYAAEEHKAVRETVGMFDLSTFVKIRLEGRDAEPVLQRICANDVGVAPGKIVYTQWLNRNGGIEADLTVTRLSETEFLIVTAAASGVRDMAWLRNHIPDDAHCIATDVTSGEGVVAVMGPNARNLLSKLTHEDLSNEAFPFGTAKTIELGMALVRAHRITYVGELGWELYVSSEMASYVAELVLAEGANHGLRPCGMHVLDSCRMEKGFRHFGHDIVDQDHVLEAGLGFAVKTGKETSKYGDFIGKDAVLKRKEEGLRKRMVQFLLTDPEPLLYHNEPIVRDGDIVGYLTSGNYGHHLGAAIGLGYVPCEPGTPASAILESSYEIEVAGKRVAATASLKPLYDPKAERIKV
ncbi:FAD-dependent oxidoreductase [Pelagibius sp. Alg239-R121]|uniref:GcvT family protein n=1 Tax=Pelagibius sp. Alg239-R121 TaxID=2993448 RepID=UPI0024A65C1F|nr:FAD-dependent oxidoreductase [Pelagibius sp. Alg239-R121]